MAMGGKGYRHAQMCLKSAILVLKRLNFCKMSLYARFTGMSVAARVVPKIKKVFALFLFYI